MAPKQDWLMTNATVVFEKCFESCHRHWAINQTEQFGRILFRFGCVVPLTVTSHRWGFFLPFDRGPFGVASQPWLSRARITCRIRYSTLLLSCKMNSNPKAIKIFQRNIPSKGQKSTKRKTEWKIKSNVSPLYRLQLNESSAWWRQWGHIFQWDDSAREKCTSLSLC